ncbi:MAG TPA: DUF1501 domain-containing protein, partial [Gemmataceae bacterium]|nr:DUF1501 domain-containing protein [Gemmataceae bacterium]
SAHEARSVIYVFLSGGLSQHESFDLKPDAPSTIRGEFNPIATATPGIRISEYLPMLAKRSRLWALCRSLTHATNDHSAGHFMMLSGRNSLPLGFDPSKPRASDWPSMSAVAGHLTRPRNNLPPAVILPEALVHREGRTIPGQFAGEMGPHWDPWVIQASPYNPTSYGAYPQYGFHHERGAVNPRSLVFQAPNLSLPQELTRGRLDGRVDLLSSIEHQQRRLEEPASWAGFDQHRQQAVSLLADPRVRQAFDVLHADAQTQERYGRNSFGWSLLMARRLIEAGVNLVQVNLGNNETWDTHQAIFPNLKNFLLPPADRAVSALLDDLAASGLLDSTLIVMAGEFGRTPRISTLPGVKLPGRDHWGAVQTVFFAGGGIRGGTVVGSSDKNAAFPDAEPQTPENLAATIYHALGIPATAAWHDVAGRPHFIYHGRPIGGLLA